ncbi:Rust resistance kinase Lr10, partial [Mucuna pruriens]
MKLFVKTIDYKSGQIQIYDPANCLPIQLLKLGNASISPFQFWKPDYDDDDTNVSFFCWDSISDEVSESELISCTKVKNVVRQVVLFYELYDRTVLMEWSKPNCSQCEARGQNCKWQNGTNGETECSVCPTKGIPTSTIVLIAAGILGLILLLLLIIALVHVCRYYDMKGEDQGRIEKLLEDYRAMKPTRFTYADIKRITNGFNQSLGEGAHGAVFKGMLSREIIVAVKILNDTVGDGKDFINEVGTIGKIHHVNVVRLLGFCADGFHRALVYHFFPNGSLQQIALGIAKGIEDFHLGCDHRILH